MQTEFSSGQGPAWSSSMPADAQTYFMTRYMQIVEYALDWGGTSSDVFWSALMPTVSDGSVVTLATTA